MGTCQISISMLDSILGQNLMTALQLMRCPSVSPGEKWHYSPLATRLAQSGIVACVVSYTLYPQASAQGARRRNIATVRGGISMLAQLCGTAAVRSD